MADVQTLEAPRAVTRASGARFALALPQVWVAAVLALPVIRVAGGLGTLDLAYHVRAGELMLAARHVLHSDPFTYTAPGPWQSTNSGEHRRRSPRSIGRSDGRAWWPGSPCCCRRRPGSCSWPAGPRGPHRAGRPISPWPGSRSARPAWPFGRSFFRVVLLAATVWLVAYYGPTPAGCGGSRSLVVLWANLHGTFFLAPLVLGLAWIADEVEGAPRAGTTLAVGAASLAATLVNPFGLRVWAYALSISTNGQISRLLTEWQPPNVRHVDDLIFFASVAAVIAVLARRSRPVPWTLLLPLGVFFVVALTATRNVLWWALAVPPILAAILAKPADAGTDASPLIEQRLPAAGERSLLNTAIAGAMAMVAVTFVGLSLDGAGCAPRPRRPSTRRRP